MTNEAKNEGSLRRLVRPAFWLVVCAGQWGPEYEPWGWGRLIDVAIRFAVSFSAACIAVKAIRSNASLERSERSDDTLRGDVRP